MFDSVRKECNGSESEMRWKSLIINIFSFEGGIRVPYVFVRFSCFRTKKFVVSKPYSSKHYKLVESFSTYHTAFGISQLGKNIALARYFELRYMPTIIWRLISITENKNRDATLCLPQITFGCNTKQTLPNANRAQILSLLLLTLKLLWKCVVCNGTCARLYKYTNWISQFYLELVTVSFVNVYVTKYQYNDGIERRQSFNA